MASFVGKLDAIIKETELITLMQIPDNFRSSSQRSQHQFHAATKTSYNSMIYMALILLFALICHGVQDKRPSEKSGNMGRKLLVLTGGEACGIGCAAFCAITQCSGFGIGLLDSETDAEDWQCMMDHLFLHGYKLGKFCKQCLNGKDKKTQGRPGNSKGPQNQRMITIICQ